MLIGHLDRPETYAGLCTNEVWKLVFDWANAARAHAPGDGEQLLQNRDVRAIVQTAQTKERSSGTFEAHRREIDVHVCLDGSEVIEVAPVSMLIPRTEYNSEKDYTLYDVPDSTERVEMIPGAFAVFFPEDGHMPQLKLRDPHVRKVVFKIRLNLVR